MNRFARSSPQRSQLLSAVLSGGAVAAVAVAFAVAGVDDVEVLATLFFAPVFISALLGGRNVGYAAAAVATVGYLALRFGDMDQSGTLRVALLVAARAGCYGVVAQATPSLHHRFPGLSGAGAFGPGSARHRAGSAALSAPESVPELALADSAYLPDLDEGSDWPEPAPALVGAGDEPASPAALWSDPPPAGPAWGTPGPGQDWEGVPYPEPLQPADLEPTQASGWDPSVEPAVPQDLEPLSAGGWEAPVDEPPDPWGAPAEPVGAPGPMADAAGGWGAPPPPSPSAPFQGSPATEGPPGWVGWDDQQSAAPATRFMSPPAPTVPTGWVDDATVPLGDESIPVGYTGELFLPRDLRQQPHLPSPATLPRNGSTNGATSPPSPSFPGLGGRHGDVPAEPTLPPPGPPPFDPSGFGSPPAGPPGPPPFDPPPGPPPFDPSGFGSPPAEPPGPPPFDPSGFAEDSAEPPGPPPFDPSGFGSPPAEPPGPPPFDRSGFAESRAEPSGPPPFEPPVDAPFGSPSSGSGWTGPDEPPPPAGPITSGFDRPRSGLDAAPPDAASASGGVDPETRLWNARFFRDRLTTARDEARRAGSPFSVVMVQVADEPFQVLPYRRQVALLRELGHQFIQARMIDHLVHLPDGAQHWFAVVLPDTDRAGAHLIERRLRSAIASYLRSRGLHLSEVQSASLTSPDDDEAMGAVWASLLGSTSVG
jgi:hypothetical protein